MWNVPWATPGWIPLIAVKLTAGQLMEGQLMTLRCDHCRGKLGLSVQRYWQMRFCSSACVDGYRRRLDDDTRVKIRHLDFVAPESPRKIDFEWLSGFIRRLPG